MRKCGVGSDLGTLGVGSIESPTGIPMEDTDMVTPWGAMSREEELPCLKTRRDGSRAS